jgi:serine/threonine-protein kinase
MGLTQKILLFTSGIIVALAAITLAFTTYQANRLADRTVRDMLGETRQVWETFQADRYAKLRLGVNVLANDPAFKSAVEEAQKPDNEEFGEATVNDMLLDRGADLEAAFMIATDPDGLVVARSDRLDARGQDLSEEPIVVEALEAEGAATVWEQDGRFYHAVSVPMITGPKFYGALVAGYAIDEQLAEDIRKLTHSEIAYLTRPPEQPPAISVSSLGSTKEESLMGLLSRPGFAEETGEPFEIPLPGDRHLGMLVPLEAFGGEQVGSVLAMRSLAVETASFRQFRNSLVVVSLVVMALAVAAGYLGSARITGPVRLLVSLVEKARDGTYSGAVSVATSDEIGRLARAFNGLLADLREKEQLIGFLREDITIIKQGGGTTSAGGAETAAIPSQGGTTVNPLRLEKGALFAGRYEIRSTLGKGGMGIVYRAKDRQLDEDVALKLLRPEVVERNPTLLERFKTELKLARKITHRNVLRTFDFSETDGVPYISMEYVEGVMLKDLLESKGALPVGVGMRIAKQICQGLEAAHHQGVVHRDIKPQNMLIIPETGEVRIMDFGIARTTDIQGEAGGGGLTVEGTVMGTPDYMPPEQAQGRPADVRSDLYSLGVVLFEMFTGQLPFVGETPVATVVQHIREAPPPPRGIRPELPEEIASIILRCMEKTPERRYPDVGALHAALTAASARIEAGAAA